MTLVGEGGVDVPVADDEFALLQGGEYLFLDELYAGGGVQKGFALIAHVGIFAVEDDFAYALGDAAAARFAGEDIVDARGVELFGEQL